MVRGSTIGALPQRHSGEVAFLSFRKVGPKFGDVTFARINLHRDGVDRRGERSWGLIGGHRDWSLRVGVWGAFSVGTIPGTVGNSLVKSSNHGGQFLEGRGNVPNCQFILQSFINAFLKEEDQGWLLQCSQERQMLKGWDEC